MEEPRTLIGDNCFSRQCYKVANLRYKTPFVNIVPWDSTFKLFLNIRNVNFKNIEEVKWEDYKDDECVPQEYKDNKTLCILVDGQYRVFVPHYSPFDKYKEIWMRRLENQTLDHLAFKINYQEPHNNKHIEEFLWLNCEKLIITELWDMFDNFVERFNLTKFDEHWAYNDRILILKEFEFTNWGKARKIPQQLANWLFYE